MGTYTYPLGSQYRLRLETQERGIGAPEIAGNYSTVDRQLYVDKLSGTGKITGNTSYWWVKFDGSFVADGSIGGYNFENYSSLLLSAGTTNVPHGSDGSKTLGVEFSFGDGGGDVGSGTGSGSMPLSTIPRASSASVSPNPVRTGDQATITISRASTAFTHEVSYSIGSKSGVIASGVATSTTWTPPGSLFTEAPTALTAVVTIITKTFSGGTQIGTSSTPLTITRSGGKIRAAGAWFFARWRPRVGGVSKEGIVRVRVAGTWKDAR